MTREAQLEYKAQARIIKALAHPTRLFIVDELARGERCVCELTDMIGVEMPTVSRHLSQLQSAGDPGGREARRAGVLPAARAVRAELFQVRRGGAEQRKVAASFFCPRI